jgi:hypothetical protein
MANFSSPKNDRQLTGFTRQSIAKFIIEKPHPAPGIWNTRLPPITFDLQMTLL